MGGNPKALTWKTESSYHPVNAERACDYRDPDQGQEIQTAEEERHTLSQNEAGLGVKAAVKLV